MGRGPRGTGGLGCTAGCTTGEEEELEEEIEDGLEEELEEELEDCGSLNFSVFRRVLGFSLPGARTRYCNTPPQSAQGL